jgi:hypothetical protein
LELQQREQGHGMNRITTANVAAAIRKVSSMSLPQKNALADEIHHDQPHLLASCVVQPKLGAHLDDVEFLLNILLVCYQAMKESGLRWPMITEDEQQRQMQRWIGALDFSEHVLSNGASDSARQQYVDHYPERPLLAFVVNETNQWLRGSSQRNGEAESDKFVMMASMNLVNCIAGAPATFTAHE